LLHPWLENWHRCKLLAVVGLNAVNQVHPQDQQKKNPLLTLVEVLGLMWVQMQERVRVLVRMLMRMLVLV
jgi:hypothetical protein